MDIIGKKDALLAHAALILSHTHHAHLIRFLSLHAWIRNFGCTCVCTVIGLQGGEVCSCPLNKFKKPHTSQVVNLCKCERNNTIQNRPHSMAPTLINHRFAHLFFCDSSSSSEEELDDDDDDEEEDEEELLLLDEEDRFFFFFDFLQSK